MGTKLAPTIATLVMAYLEIKLYQVIETKYDRLVQEEFIRKWRRFLDDCFINWDTRTDTAVSLVSILNNLHPSIKFKEKFSRFAIDYLDTTVKAENRKITTYLFQKVTDSHHYVPFISCHPSQTKRNIPFNLARKICTIVDEENSKEKRMDNLQRTLTRQRYPPKLIDASTNEVKKIPKQKLCQNKLRNEDNKWLLTFVST